MTDTIESDFAPAPGRPAVPFRRRLTLLARSVLPPLAFCALVILAWELMARSLASPLVPDVREVYGELVRIVPTGEAMRQIGLTLGRIVAGSGFAFVLGAFLGFGAGGDTARAHRGGLGLRLRAGGLSRLGGGAQPHRGGLLRAGHHPRPDRAGVGLGA